MKCALFKVTPILPICRLQRRLKLVAADLYLYPNTLVALKIAGSEVKEKGQYPMQQVGADDVGFAIYQIDLQQ